jgi:N-acetylmuramoyl-L-alanine amidase
VHYTIEADGRQNQYHSEDQKAFFAGVSSWHGKTKLNNNGIGIMLINDAKSPFPDAQIAKLAATILDINARHDTTMEVVGLGETTVGREANRHIAPGALFPWAKLAESGIGTAINIPDAISKECSANYTASHIQKNLIQHGYGITETGTLDDKTNHAIDMFTDRYLPGHENCWSDATEYALNVLIGANGTHEEL